MLLNSSLPFSILCLSVLMNARVTTSSDMPCVPKTMQPGGGFVCVCNATYCDTINRPERLPQGQFHHYSTSNSTPGFSHSVGTFTTSPPVYNDDFVFTVNSSVLYQEFLGCGGAFTDSTGIVLQTLPLAAQEQLIQSYFSPSGLEYTIGRLPIGCSDFSNRSYTLDDVPNDDKLEYFNLTFEDYNYKIPLLKKAMAISERPIKIMACTWRAPDWMKITANFKSFLLPNQLETFAQYHLKFLQAYHENGIDMWSISGGNEVFVTLFLPLDPDYTLMTAPTQRQWFKGYLKPLLAANNFSDVKIVALEDEQIFINYWMARFYDDEDSRQSVDAIGIHWYFDWFVPSDELDIFHQNYPDKLILYTESSINGAFDADLFNIGSWMAGASYIYNFMLNFNRWIQTYVDWNLWLNLDYGPTVADPVVSAIVVNETSGEFYKQPIFYAMGHLSKFFPPGSRRMMVTSYHNQTNGTSTDEGPPERMTLEEIKKNLKSGLKSGVGGSFPIPLSVTIPDTLMSVGAANPDGIYTVMVFSNMNETQHVRIEDARLGTISVDIQPLSINSFVYWY